MKVTVRVPATSANLGPGFDVCGLALTLYNTFTFELIPQGLEFAGCDEAFCNKDNLIYQSFLKAAQKVNLKFDGLKITVDANVPNTRGLGSSSTCIVAGIVAAFTFKDQQDDKKAILNLATQIEGHPDNVAPAIYGGMTVSAMLEDVVTMNIPVKNKYKFMTLIPDFELSTAQSRGVLPDAVDRKDAIYNVSHISLLLASLIHGNDQYLKEAFKDQLHQPYRGHLIKHYDEIMKLLNDDSNVLGSYLSGAGPTIMVVLKENEDTAKLLEVLKPYIEGWQVKELSMDTTGYTYVVE